LPQVVTPGYVTPPPTAGPSPTLTNKLYESISVPTDASAKVRDIIRLMCDKINLIMASLLPAGVFARGAADLTLTTTPTPIGGCQVTFTRTGQWLITGTYHFSGATAAVGKLTIAGLLQTGEAYLDSGEASVTQQWVVNGKMGQQTQLIALGAGTAVALDCTISAVYVGSGQ